LELAPGRRGRFAAEEKLEDKKEHETRGEAVVREEERGRKAAGHKAANR
jgi:hypothetical protein